MSSDERERGLKFRERLGLRLAGQAFREYVRSLLTTGSVFTTTTHGGGPRGGLKLTNPYSQHPVVYACVKFLGDNVSQVPFKLYKSTNEDERGETARERFNLRRLYERDGVLLARDMERGEGVEEVTTGDLRKLFDRPNPLMSGNQFWNATTVLLSYKGEVDVICQDRSDPTKTPTELYPEKPEYLQPKPDRQLVPQYWKYLPGGELTKSKNIDTWELIRPRTYNPEDPRRGLSPLSVLSLTLANDWNARLYNNAYFSNDATPGGFMFTERPMKKKQRDDWLKGYYKQHRGAENAFKWALLDGIKDVRPLTHSPKDAQFTDLMVMDKEEIAMVYRIPMVLLSRTAEINYATDKAERRGVWTTTLIPIIRHLEDIFWSELFQWIEGGNVWGAFDLSEVEDLQEGLDALLERANKLYKMKVPFNRINDRLGLGFDPDEIPGGDTWIVNINSMPIEYAVEGAGLTTKTQPQSGGSNNQEPRALATKPETDKERAKRVAKVVKGFNRLRAPHVKEFTKRYREYLRQYRKEVLDNIDKYYRLADWDDIYLGTKAVWDRALERAVEGVYLDAIGDSATFTANELGGTPFITATSPEAIKIIEDRLAPLTGTNDTLRDNLRREIATGMQEGETVNEVKRRVKRVMNIQDSRALTIARTEVGAATSGARFSEMKAQGVMYTSWSTVGPGTTPPRESHIAAQAVGPKPLGETFANTGCRYPHDPEGAASEVINCRCVSVPETRGLTTNL